MKTHINNIFQKLGIRDRVELALYAMRTGHHRRARAPALAGAIVSRA